MLHTIKVDDDVWRHLQAHAKPFEDTPTSVLRRLLLKGDSDRSGGNDTSKTEPLHLSAALPQALRHILNVLFHVKECGQTRVDATKLVAEDQAVASQTIIAAYTRQIGLNTYEFDRLTETDMRAVEKRLCEKFPRHCADINAVFSERGWC